MIGKLLFYYLPILFPAITIDNRNTVKGLETDSLQNCNCDTLFPYTKPVFHCIQPESRPEFQYCQSKLAIEGKVESYLALPDNTQQSGLVLSTGALS